MTISSLGCLGRYLYCSSKATILSNAKLSRMNSLCYVPPLQDFLHIERKNQIEIEENKRTHNLSIKDNNYYKKQERQKNDIDLEL